MFIAILCTLIVAFGIVKLFQSRKGRLEDRFRGSNCLITGGSDGLGKAVALQLSQLGANLVICARNKDRLEEALEEIRKAALRPDQQRFGLVQVDVTDGEAAREAVGEAEQILGDIPNLVITCAGAAKPGMFVEQSLDDFHAGMELNYFGVLNIIQPAIQRMISGSVRDGHIVLIASTLGLLGMVGYAQYSPTKFALRGLAECLRQELMAWGVGVSVFFVSTIRSAGLERENRTKPAVTRAIEEGDPSDPSPEARARTLLEGIAKGQFAITSDLLTDVFRASAIGNMPRNNILIDAVLGGLAFLILPVWRRFIADASVISEFKKNL